MAEYPLLFGFSDVVAGSGYWARVAIDGRVLLVQDEDGAWLYGVQPGGIAGHGATVQEAHQDFRAGYRSVLADLAEEAENFTAFEALVSEFLNTVNRPNEAHWEQLVQLVRAGKLDLEWLPQRSADLARCVKIVELEDPRSEINDPDTQSPVQSLAA
jgi:hypothetical protein